MLVTSGHALGRRPIIPTTLRRRERPGRLNEEQGPARRPVCAGPVPPVLAASSPWSIGRPRCFGIPSLVAVPVPVWAGIIAVLFWLRAGGTRTGEAGPDGGSAHELAPSTGPLLSIVVGYLLFLFGVAYWAERTRRLERPRLQMLTYVLTASVYCTAWTFYGSVGPRRQPGPRVPDDLPRARAPRAPLAGPAPTPRPHRQGAADHLDLGLHLEPLRQVGARSARWSPRLVVVGLIPYIALQLQAVSQSFKVMLQQEAILDRFDPTLLVAVVLGLFGILFGARNPGLHAGPARLADRGRRRIGREAARVPHRRRLRDVDPLRRIRRPLRPAPRRSRR